MTELVTDPAEYLVHNCRQLHVWLHVLHGEDSGIRIAIPRRHPEYDRELTRAIASLEPGEVIRATLRSREGDRIAWRIEELLDTEVYPVPEASL